MMAFFYHVRQLVDCFHKQYQLVVKQIFAFVPGGVVYFEIGLLSLPAIILKI